MVEEHRAFVDLVTELRKLGAVRVRAGDLAAELAPVGPPPAPRLVESAEERRKREAEEAERDLFWSTGT